MKQSTAPSDLIFQTSWEVCNKVGGIYTVLSTQAKALTSIYKDNLIFIGPDLNTEDNPLFIPDAKLLKTVVKNAEKEGVKVRMGRWNIPGEPIVALVDFKNLFAEKSSIYTQMWNDFEVDSLHAYGDYDEACLFSYQAGRFASIAYKYFCKKEKRDLRAVFQAHEWMSGFGLLYIKKNEPGIATVFTTHATTVGRSITTNNKELYEYFNGYQGDQMAAELNVHSKHSVEKKAALNADCLTTVSNVTDRECEQFFGRKSDVILPNGFDPSFVSKGTALNAIKRRARKAILNTYNALSGSYLTDDTLIVSTSGRNDFRCKGFDLYINALKRLQSNGNLKRHVLALIAVPCWKKEARKDLIERLALKPAIKLMDASEMEPLPNPFITHELYNFDTERIIQTIYGNGFSFDRNEKVHIMLIPTYLDGQDGIFNMPYYDFLTGSDYCIYPSYYEPWGYTPLESVAFGIPCLTTNLAGFGVWVNEQVGHQAILSDGVAVITRTDHNFDSCAYEIESSILGMTMLSAEERKKFSEAAYKLSLKAMWKDFIKHYLTAYTMAVKNVKK